MAWYTSKKALRLPHNHCIRQDYMLPFHACSRAHSCGPGRLLFVLATAQLFCLSVPAQDTVTVADKQIMQEIREHNELMNNLEYLSDVIGPRVTGTEQLNQAVNWAQDLCHRYKLGNVHRESWKIGHSWQRGAAVARIVNPVSRSLTIASSGWSPATRGTVRGNVMYVPAVHAEELQFYRGKLRGAIVIYQQLVNLSPQPFVTGSAPPPIQTPAPVPDRTSPSPEAAFNSARMAFFKEEGALAVLRDSGKLYNLLTMTSVGGNEFQIGAVPTAMLTHEDYGLIFRLLKRGPVRLELNISNSFSDGPVETYNTVAEIRGAERPDEVVILTAHLDSWDLGSGATDDGT